VEPAEASSVASLPVVLRLPRYDGEVTRVPAQANDIRDRIGKVDPLNLEFQRPLNQHTGPYEPGADNPRTGSRQAGQCLNSNNELVKGFEAPRLCLYDTQENHSPTLLPATTVDARQYHWSVPHGGNWRQAPIENECANLSRIAKNYENNSDSKCDSGEHLEVNVP
jgi:hypothetical protein